MAPSRISRDGKWGRKSFHDKLCPSIKIHFTEMSRPVIVISLIKGDKTTTCQSEIDVGENNSINDGQPKFQIPPTKYPSVSDKNIP